MTYWLILIPFISAVIGWGINSLAVKMLFYPQIPKRFLGIRFQGLLPRRQPLLAEQVGKWAASEFASLDLEQKINNPALLEKIIPLIEAHVDDFLRNKLKAQMPVISMFVGDKTIQTMKGIFMQEIQNLFPGVMKQLATNLKDDLKIEQIISNKISSISSSRLEQALSRELRWIGLTGAVTGFLIGLLQIAISFFIIY